MRAPTSFRRTIAYRLLESSSRSTSHTGTTTIAPVSRMRPTWLDIAESESTICLAAADSLGKQRRRIEAKSLENDPDNERDDNQAQRRPSPAIRRANRPTALVMTPKTPISRSPGRAPAAVAAGSALEHWTVDGAASIRPSETARPTATSAGDGLVGFAADLLAVDRQAPVRGAELDRRAVGDLAGEQHLRQRVLHPFLDHPLQRTRAIGRIVALCRPAIAAPWRRG